MRYFHIVGSSAGFNVMSAGMKELRNHEISQANRPSGYFIIAKSPLSAGLPLLLKSYIMQSNMFAVVVLSAVALTESGP